MYSLRPYQSDAVKAIIHYFRRHQSPAVAVLPTGAGKSLVIAELAKIAKGRVLVLAHVKELVEQNHEKYESYGINAGIFSAGLGRKESKEKVIFASIQSVARNMDAFKAQFSLLIIDECHRVPENEKSSYRKVISHLQSVNSGIKILGFTATPYRLGIGWIYQFHTSGKVRSEEARFFRDCIFELPIHFLLNEGFLTPPKLIDAPILSYDFSKLKASSTGIYKEDDLNKAIDKAKRATPQIIEQIITQSQSRYGVMIFAATVRHAQEILSLLPEAQSALIIGDTSLDEREKIIEQFKNRAIKFLVNVSVLTTGFDAPHVDLIAILRPTESVSLYQQIVGRGLRLSPNKKDCLILDYAGNAYDLYQPEIGEIKPNNDSQLATIPCPACGFNNDFWAKVDDRGFVIEHYGRRCQGFFVDDEGEREICGYRFRAKYCNECGADNDIAARVCHACEMVLVDPDKKLRDALKLKDAMIMVCQAMALSIIKDKNNQSRLKITYIGQNDASLHEFWSLNTPKQKAAFLTRFVRPHLIDRHREFTATSPSKVLKEQHRLRFPDVIIARKKGRFWSIREKIFDLDQFMSSEERAALKL